MKPEAIAAAVFAVATAVGGVCHWHTAVIVATAVVSAACSLYAGRK